MGRKAVAIAAAVAAETIAAGRLASGAFKAFQSD
jgi:hypothetical protein